MEINKQETLEEAAEKFVFETNKHKWSNNDNTAGDNYNSFKEGAKWQAERMYSEEEVYNLLYELLPDKQELDEWFKDKRK